MTVPTEAELKAAFAVIQRAENHVLKMMEDAGIPRPSASIYYGYTNHPTVSLRSNKKVFLNCDGKRNCESASSLYRSVAATISEIELHLERKKQSA